MITLRDALPQYVAYRRALGTKLHEPAKTLADFVNFMERQRAAFITTDLALGWAMKPQGLQRAKLRAGGQHCAGVRSLAQFHRWPDRSAASTPACGADNGLSRRTSIATRRSK